MKKVIRTPIGPSAIGPYSQAMKAGNLVFVSGQIPLDPATGKQIEDQGIAAQTRRCIENLKGILAAADCGLKNVVRTTVFLKDMNNFAEMNSVYGEYFHMAPPARSTVEVSRLPKDVDVEIDCIAVLD